MSLARVPIHSQAGFRASDRVTDHESSQNSDSHDEHLKKLSGPQQEIPSRHGDRAAKSGAAADQQNNGRNEHDQTRSPRLPAPEIGDEHRNDGGSKQPHPNQFDRIRGPSYCQWNDRVCGDDAKSSASHRLEQAEKAVF